MRILVTGSSGVIGRHLVISLKKHKIEPILFHKNTQDPKEYGDITDFSTLKEKFNACHGIVHLAAISRVKFAENNPERCYEVNVKGTENVLRAAQDSPNKPWVVYVSSQEIYGNQNTFPVKESAKPNPLNIYAKTKYEGEKLTEQFGNNGLKTSIVRLSSVYGSIHDYPDKVAPAFCNTAAKGKNLTLNGGNKIFDFTHITDITAGLMKIINIMQDGHQHLPTLHLVSGKGTKLSELAKIAISAGNSNAKVIQTNTPNNNINKFYGDPELAKQILNWETHISIEQGICDLVKYFMQRSQK